MGKNQVFDLGKIEYCRFSQRRCRYEYVCEMFYLMGSNFVKEHYGISLEKLPEFCRKHVGEVGE